MSPSIQSPLLQDKVIIITGAASGLGRAYAEHAARSGASVVVNDVDPVGATQFTEKLSADGLSATSSPGDISDWKSSGELIDGTVARFGRIDGLVNNAGIFYRSLPWADNGERAARVVAVNLLGVLNCGFHAMRVMRAQGRGTIVNVTSGAHVGMSEMGTYGASKGGVASATYSWAVDLAGTGVRVNAVSPLAATSMAMSSRGTSNPAQTGLADADRIAPLVTYLLSDLSSSLNGQVFRLDGASLSVMQHPRIGSVRLTQESWTVDSIAAAVDGPLSGDLHKP